MIRLRPLLQRYRSLSREELAQAIEVRLFEQPRCAASRYLAGCLAFDDGRRAIAVRHWMIAQHAEPQFQSAALLVFTGLNAIARPADSVWSLLRSTYAEFREPTFGERPKEQLLFAAFEEPPPPAVSSDPQTAHFWRLPLHSLRAELRQLAVAAAPLPAGLLGATAL